MFWAAVIPNLEGKASLVFNGVMPVVLRGLCQQPWASPAALGALGAAGQSLWALGSLCSHPGILQGLSSVPGALRQLSQATQEDFPSLQHCLHGPLSAFQG